MDRDLALETSTCQQTLGTFVPFRGHSFWQFALGLYFISLGINYVPLLLYAVAITRRQRARAEMGG
jgi:hypothetical protein